MAISGLATLCAGRRPNTITMALTRSYLVALCGICLLSTVFTRLSAQEVPPGPSPSEAQLKSLKARSIGPAVMGGRISDIALDPKNPHLFYVAWRRAASSRRRMTASLSSRFSISNRCSPSARSPWRLPTRRFSGSARARRMTVTPPAGATAFTARPTAAASWQHVGLDNSRAINRVVVDPRNPDVAYVAAVGEPVGRDSRARTLQNGGRRQDLEERPPGSQTP